MSTWKDDRGRWHAGIMQNRKRLHRILPPGASSADAKRLESELRASIGKRPSVALGDPAITAVMDLYAAHAQHLRSPETAMYHAARVGEWIKLYRASQARQCAAHIIADLKSQYKPATINRSLGTIKKALALAWERGITPVNYGDHIKFLAENNARTTHLTLNEVAQLTAHMSEQVKAVTWIALLTGLRRREVLTLKPEMIKADYLQILAANTKTNKHRNVPIIPALRPWLKFVPFKVTYEGVKSSFRRAREAVSMTNIQFRDLRRSCGHLLLELEVPLDVIRDVLGHTSIRTTEKHYAHAILNRQRAAMNKLSDKVLHQKLHQR